MPQIYADPTKRLELYFRPKDPYCHPVCANRFSTSSLLFRIRRKTKRQREVLGLEAQPEVTFDIEILGIISTVYKFQGNCNFLHWIMSGPASTFLQVLCGSSTGKGASLCPGVRGRGGAEWGSAGPRGTRSSLRAAVLSGLWAHCCLIFHIPKESLSL